MSKKIFACLMTLAVLFSAFAVMASALPVTSETVTNLNNGINITYVSSKGKNAAGSTVNWAPIFSATNTSPVNLNATAADPIEVIGEFDDPTVVTRISFAPNTTYPQRINNITVFLSSDNESWVEMFQTSGIVQNTGNLYFDMKIDDTNEYKYIKLTHGSGWMGLSRCIVESNAAMSGYVKATPVSNSDASDNRPVRGIWSPDNVSIWVANNTLTTAAHYSAAQLAEPTVIGKIEFTTGGSNGTRARGAKFLGSTDGTNWTLLDTMASSASNSTKYTFTIDDPTAYSYVKIEQADSLIGNYFDALRVVVFAAEPEPVIPPAVTFKGVQVRDDGDKYSLRFVALLDNGEFDVSDFEVAYKVTATYLDGEGQVVILPDYTGSITKVFTSVEYTEGGVLKTQTAADLGGTYMITLVARNIPDSYGDIEFRLEFTATDPDGVVTESVPFTVTSNAGEIIV